MLEQVNPPSEPGVESPLNPAQTSDPHRRHSHHRSESRLRAFLRKYWFELIWVLLVFLGIFLIFERMNVRGTLLRWLSAFVASVVHWAGYLDNTALDTIQRLTLSDALGIALLLGAVVVLLVRLRWWLLRIPVLTDPRCPVCGSELHQIHRRTIHRLISWYMPLRRYNCANRDCRWVGTKIKMSRANRRRSAVLKGEVVVWVVLVILVVIFIGYQIASRGGGGAGPDPGVWIGPTFFLG